MTAAEPVLYGISNCDTVRRARRELREAGVACRFHDFRKDGLDPDTLDRWLDAVGWEALLNRRGTTWRRLPADTRATVDASGARALMLAEPTLIKRPVIEHSGQVSVGWDETTATALGARR
ncbi:arsenate reductase-like protein [Thioalkalivibrio nitratireducens DSM 14787]|uniref:Arsenate reductase-like protein n=1 Tax=Thioalkalivibrio nitratireducens (strain DSM 14787 / UNIQEM 213 / ALEN2) TaxID=1255043 RepID=L0DWT8_THIND|nr:ArsC family reductase [Thioalkalivibrio nitratireducens]AGA33508.1 arsenate reductase-like protein [Thioalkalivibrio nitratireducens DSM 14787]